VEINTHRDAGRWSYGGGTHTSVLLKGEQRGRRCLFIIGLGTGKFLVWRRIFARICPNFHEKFFVQLLPTNSLPRRSRRPFWYDLQKRSSCDFLQTLGSQARLSAIFTRIFRDVSQIFSKSKLLGCAWSPSPTSTTVFHNSIIGNFVVYQDRLKINLLQLFGHPDNLEWFSIISVIIFEVKIVDEHKQTLLVTIVLFFISFHCPKMFYCSACPTAAPAPLNMHVVSTNFAKTLVANPNMTSHCDQ